MRKIADIAPPSPRDQSRALVLGAVARSPRVSRATVADVTGLSRSTVFRVTDDLIRDGFLAESAVLAPTGRGRPTRPLSISRSYGYVAGIDIGVASCRMLAADLNDDILGRWQRETPTELPVAELADWLVTAIREHGAKAGAGPLRQVVVSVPAAVHDGIVIERPARALAHLAGTELYAQLGKRLGVPLTMRRDPEMALLGEMVAGKAVGRQDVALFVISGAVSASVAIDGRLLDGDRRVLGEFGVMPFETGTLSDVLTVSGLIDRCREKGVSVESLDALLDALRAEQLREVRGSFVSGLAFAIAAIALSVDPDMVLINGRLLPLVEELLEDVRERLRALLPEIPEIDLTDMHGFSQPRGAVALALEMARAEMLADSLRD